MDNEFLHKISDYAYFKSNNVDICMNDNIVEIGAYAYANIDNIKITKLSNNLKVIREFAFCDSNVDVLNLPKGLETIGLKAFSGCKTLKKVIIPEGVTEIGDAAFANCKNLEEVYLPNSLRSLSRQLFLNCKNLKKVHLPDGTTHLPDEIFKGCSSLDIDLDGIISIGRGVFNNCTNLSKIPASVSEFHSYDFKGCKNLKEVHINPNITMLPDHLFDGCINLHTITIDNPVVVGNHTFRNCISLRDIPNNIKDFGKYAFENCLGLTSITLNTRHIPEGCFRGCRNLVEIKDFDNVREIDSYALDNTGFVSLDLSNIEKISNNILSNCRNLQSVNLGSHQSIGDYAFYHSPILEIKLPKTIKTIGKMAFARNETTKKLVIPRFLEKIGVGAFAYNNLESITCNHNKKYHSFDNRILLETLNEEVILYTNGSKDKFYNLTDYAEQDNMIVPLNAIGPYAFAGAKYLEELGVPSSVADIEKTAFNNTKNLRTMSVYAIPMMSLIHFGIKNKGRIYYDPSEFDSKKKKEEPFLPFEKVNFCGENINISASSFQYFELLNEISFHDNKSIMIDNNTFYHTNISHVYLPKEISSLGIRAFNDDCIVEFENGLKLNVYRFLRDSSLFYKYGLYELKDSTYLVEGNNRIVAFNEDTMEKYTKNYMLIKGKPTKFIDYYYSLIDFGLVDEEILRNGLFMKLQVDNRRKFLSNYDKNDTLLKDVLESSGMLDNHDKYTYNILDTEEGIEKFYQYIELLRKYEIKDKIFYHRVLIDLYNIEEMDSLFYANKELLLETINKMGIPQMINNDEKVEDSLLKDKRLHLFLSYVIKYNLKDPFLFQPAFMGIASSPLADKFFQTFDNNTKRLIKSSGVLENKNLGNSIQNLNDLLTLCYITGGLEIDEIIRQRALTFITEKITMNLGNGTTNSHRVQGDDFHRLFNFGDALRNEFDLEFANFFLENYNDLYRREIQKSGFIQRAYVNFREISKTSTADNGSQRHKKVTMQKVAHYLSKNKFTNVAKEERELADFIGEWYDSESAWERCQQLVKEMKSAPRNIFTKYTYDEDGKKCFNDNKTLDLREKNRTGFSYEWLPKDNWDNFILGKYCNCCAHLTGAGNGIMRASIISDDVQNLVIRNGLGEIVAKSTLFVNRQEGYGVFNNVEASLQLSYDDLTKVCEALIRGAKDFWNKYNENNEIKLKVLTIGAGRNRINEQLENMGCKITNTTYRGISFRDYSFNKTGYAGDWEGAQRLVLAKKSKGEKK